MRSTQEILIAAKKAGNVIKSYTPAQLDAALSAMAKALAESTDTILAANAQDLEAARGRISDVMLDRLRLDHGRVQAM
ncbi:MAG: gamma-glutamyl-phosphate reductase, partial [Clostridia bacterium]|nr:gamma-glutamyl-phosphate reductase [Clostridia bacterium]